MTVRRETGMLWCETIHYASEIFLFSQQGVGRLITWCKGFSCFILNKIFIETLWPVFHYLKPSNLNTTQFSCGSLRHRCHLYRTEPRPSVGPCRISVMRRVACEHMFRRDYSSTDSSLSCSLSAIAWLSEWEYVPWDNVDCSSCQHVNLHGNNHGRLATTLF